MRNVLGKMSAAHHCSDCKSAAVIALLALLLASIVPRFGRNLRSGRNTGGNYWEEMNRFHNLRLSVIFGGGILRNPTAVQAVSKCKCRRPPQAVLLPLQTE